MNLIFLLIGILLGVGISWLYFKSKTQISFSSKELDDKITLLDKEKSILLDRHKNTLETYNKLQQELVFEKEKHDLAKTRIAKAEEAFKNMNEKLSAEKQDKEELQKKFNIEFENIATKIMEDKSKRFTEQNKTNLDIILNPLKEKIKDFEDKIDKTYKAESAERITLKLEIKNLMELNKQLSEEANNLASALKGDNKKQGNWGEIILEKILERSGLSKNQEYKLQVSSSNEDGKRVQPDAVVFLPDNKHIIIDSKVSLIAYEAFVNSDNEDEKERFKKDHVKSLKSHISLLSDKNYQTSPDFNTPDFVLLFVPIESSFSLAIQADIDIFNFAWDKKIVIVSPSTLLATLKTIDSLWKQENQTKNVMEIARQAGALIDKFVGFVDDMDKIGKSMDNSKVIYDSAMNKLTKGTGNLIKRVQEIEKLGAKNNKSIPLKFHADDNEKLIEDSKIEKPT